MQFLVLAKISILDPMNRKKIIIVGGGFAGIQFMEHLDEKLFRVLILDKLNHYQFQPLFYQVATSQIEPSSISFFTIFE